MERASSSRFLEHAGGIASYYGFRPLREVDPAFYRTHVGRGPASFNEAAALCAQCTSSRQAEPVLAYWATPSLSHTPTGISARDAAEFSLQVSGSLQCLGEIVVLKALSAILSEWGTPVARLRVNAFGDRDSRERYARELSAFVKRRLGSPVETVPEEIRSKALAEPFMLYTSDNAALRELLAEAPRPVHFLSERSRAHFREFLDYLEQVNLPYELDDSLGGDSREPRIVFRADLEGGDSVVLGTHGGRYDDFVARLAGRREYGSVHASIFFRKRGAPRSFAPRMEPQKPKMYFIQLGVRAKLQGLTVLDALRHAQIPVAQNFNASTLAPQLQAAQQAGVPYVLIMGQREALDGTVIVRSTRNSSQDIVELATLPKYLRTLRV